MDADAIRKNVDDLSRELLIGEPYFGHLLVGTLRLAVAGDFAARLSPSAHLARIEVGAARWQTLSPAARKAALKHELLHLTLKHPLRARSFALLELYGLACDLVVNQYIDTTHLEGAFTLAMFPGLLPNQTADHYYAALLPLYERCACDGGACSGEAGDGDGRGDASSPERALRDFLRDSEACRSHGSWRAFRQPAVPCPLGPRRQRRRPRGGDRQAGAVPQLGPHAGVVSRTLGAPHRQAQRGPLAPRPKALRRVERAHVPQEHDLARLQALRHLSRHSRQAADQARRGRRHLGERAGGRHCGLLLRDPRDVAARRLGDDPRGRRHRDPRVRVPRHAAQGRHGARRNRL
ncbi:MAG: hypothetical protein IPG50_05740 [Myxococcales bacterium]|nr:hypothetical protein [Myxococcales bacterium]